MVVNGLTKDSSVKQAAFDYGFHNPFPSHPLPRGEDRPPLPFRLGKALKTLLRRRLQAESLFPLPYEGEPERLLERFLEAAKEDGEVNPTGFVEEAIPLFLRLTPYYALGLKARGRLPQGLVLDLAMAAWRLLHGPKPPGDYPFTPELWDYFQRMVNTARLFLLAARR